MSSVKEDQVPVKRKERRVKKDAPTAADLATAVDTFTKRLDSLERARKAAERCVLPFNGDLHSVERGRLQTGFTTADSLYFVLDGKNSLFDGSGGFDALTHTIETPAPEAGLLAKSLAANTSALDPEMAKRKARRDAPETAGDGWFGMRRPVITPELEQDLEVIRMRGHLNPKHFFKRPDNKKGPRFFEMGRVIGGAEDDLHGVSAGPSKKRSRRAQPLVDALLEDENLRRRTKSKFLSIQEKRMAGRKGGKRRIKH